MKYQFARNLFMDHFRQDELQVGDVVYYLSPFSKYSIKKSTIVSKKEIPANHHTRPFGGCELTLTNGVVLEYGDVFDSKENAFAYIVADLKSSLANKRNALQTLQQEIEKEERVLTQLMNKKYGKEKK